MSRVLARPTALVDGTPEAARIVDERSDAAHYVDEGRVFEKIPDFLFLLGFLENPNMPRLGFVKVGAVANHVVTVVQGEDVPATEPKVVYGFGIASDGGTRFLELSRIVGDASEVLAYADLTEPTNPVFRDINLVDVITDEAKISELTQLIAVGEDAAEWALD